MIAFFLNFQALSFYVDMVFRPFARLLAISFLPPLVAILDLKPCRLFLTNLLGWYVLFIK